VGLESRHLSFVGRDVGDQTFFICDYLHLTRHIAQVHRYSVSEVPMPLCNDRRAAAGPSALMNRAPLTGRLIITCKVLSLLTGLVARRHNPDPRFGFAALCARSSALFAALNCSSDSSIF
jgi:hypothetical protein